MLTFYVQFKYILNWGLKCFWVQTNTHETAVDSSTWDLMLSQLIVLVGLLHGPDGVVVDLHQPLQSSWKLKTENKQRRKLSMTSTTWQQGRVQRGKTADGVVDKAFGKEMRGDGNVNKPKNIDVPFWGSSRVWNGSGESDNNFLLVADVTYGLNNALFYDEFSSQRAVTQHDFMLRSQQAAQKLV